MSARENRSSHALATALMTAFPYAICMPKADRNLFEVRLLPRDPPPTHTHTHRFTHLSAPSPHRPTPTRAPCDVLYYVLYSVPMPIGCFGCLVLGAWCLVLDAWCLVLGAWCLQSNGGPASPLHSHTYSLTHAPAHSPTLSLTHPLAHPPSHSPTHLQFNAGPDSCRFIFRSCRASGWPRSPSAFCGSPPGRLVRWLRPRVSPVSPARFHRRRRHHRAAPGGRAGVARHSALIGGVL